MKLLDLMTRTDDHTISKIIITRVLTRIYLNYNKITLNALIVESNSKNYLNKKLDCNSK
jgi:hypothetical protein